MLIRFKAKTMQKYAGIDGLGGSIALGENETAEVSEAVGKILLQKYGTNFEVIIQEKPMHAPQADKFYRKQPLKVKTK